MIEELLPSEDDGKVMQVQGSGISSERGDKHPFEHLCTLPHENRAASFRIKG